MTLGTYWEIIKRSWKLLVLTTVLFTAAALLLSLRMTPMYQATAQLFVSVRSSDGISGAYTGGLYVQQRIKSYVTVVDSPGVLQPVIDDLQLDLSTGDLAGMVSVQNPMGTVLLEVVADNTDPQQAQLIANATARSLASEIVRLESSQSGGKPVRVEVIRPATTPGSPVSPRTRLNVAIGFIIGLVIGAGLALLRATFDTSVKTAEQLTEATGATLLATIPQDSSAAKNPLVMLQGSTVAESYRTLRTNLQYVDIDNPPQSVVITSCLPLEGKSTTAANLAIALAQGGAKVLLVEADLRRPRIADYLGVAAGAGLTDVLTGKVDIADAIVGWQRNLVDFLPAGAIPPNPSELLGSRQMAELLDELRTRYDMVILDSPPLLPVTDAAILATVADGAILVTRYGKTHKDQAAEAADSVRQINARLYGAVLNFVPRKRRHRRGYDYNYKSSTSQQAEAPRPASSPRSSDA